MTDLRDTVEMASNLIDALEGNKTITKYGANTLRQALAQPEQEPVAWIKPDKENSGFLITLYEENGWTPLYTAPPSKPWAIADMVQQKFQSGNNVPVERVTITRSEYETALRSKNS